MTRRRGDIPWLVVRASLAVAQVSMHRVVKDLLFPIVFVSASNPVWNEASHVAAIGLTTILVHSMLYPFDYVRWANHSVPHS